MTRLSGSTPLNTPSPQQSAAKGKLPMGMAPTPHRTLMKPSSMAQPNYMTGMTPHTAVSNTNPYSSSMQTGGQSWNASGVMKPTSSLDSLMSLPSQAKTPTLNNMQSSFGTQQFGVRPMSYGVAGNPSRSSGNAFQMANPFMAPTNIVKNGQTQPQSNLSKQELLDFLG